MIHCVAIDDEPIALSIISEYASRYGNMELKCFTSPVEGMDFIRDTRPDVVFLDIEMNSHNGIELARELPEGTTLIFTTAYARYALDGFNVNAVDFLHKPIFYPRFVQAMDKARAWVDRDRPAASPECITLKSGHRTVVVGLDSIKHVEAMDNYVKVYRKDLPMVVSQITMKEMESMLPSDRFVRVHRSFIVSLKAVESFSNRKIQIRGVQMPIPVGRTYTDSVRAAYERFGSERRPD
ncbi:MAG: LytTR family DNA-binding domain-containing protein [Muribaculaceae bacterium]|nr:LytTR family DNA-binding domain-containing protein [Muribaculaceae bacterium]